MVPRSKVPASLLRVFDKPQSGPSGTVLPVPREGQGFSCARHPTQTHLAILAYGINFVDLQGGQALADEAKRRQREGGDLYLINVKQGLWETLEACGCIEARGARNVFRGKEAAIHAI